MYVANFEMYIPNLGMYIPNFEMEKSLRIKYFL
jgi:hypothetical protein